MSSNANDQDQRSQRPTARIVDAYEMNLEARRQFLESKGAGESAQQAAHQHLHQTTMTYFEALRYLLATTDGVSEYWDGDEVKLWQEQQFVPVDEDADLERTEDGHLFDPETGYLVGPDSGLLIDPNSGEPIVQNVWLTGLERLEYWFDETRVVEREISDAFGKRTVTEERPQRLAPAVLMRVCRGLDEAAKNLGVLTESKESTPRTEIGDDLMDELDEWREENVEQ